MRYGFLGMASVLAVACAACTGPTRTKVDPGTLSGKFNGTDWTFVSGGTSHFNDQGNKYLSYLRAVDVSQCDQEAQKEIKLEIPFKPGVYELGLTLTATFKFDPDALEATTGELIVHEVTDTIIKGGLYTIYNDNPNYEVSGQFVVEICN